MMFEVRWDPKAEEQLEKLPKDISRRIVNRVRAVVESGKGIEHLRDFKYGFKIRIGDYRALVDIYYNDNIIIVRVVDHRKRVYKR